MIPNPYCLPTEQRVAVVETDLTHIRQDVEEMKTKIDALHDAYMKGRGAWWVLVGFLSIGAGVVGATINKWFSFLSK